MIKHSEDRWSRLKLLHVCSMCCCYNDSTNPKFSTKIFIDSELVPSEDKAEPALKLYARVSRVIFDI